MAFTYVSGVVNGGNSTSVTTDAIDTTGATFIVLFACDSNFNVSDSKGNTPSFYHAVNSDIRFYVYIDPTVGSGHTFTLSSGFYPSLGVSAFQTSADGELDQDNSNTNTGTTVTTGSVTPTANDELLLAGCSWGTTNNVSIDGGFSLIGSRPALSGRANALAYLIQTTATAANPTFTAGGSSDMLGAIVTFKEAGGGGGGALPKIIQTLQAPMRASFF